MSHRRLAVVSGLTLGDYVLWNWSLNGNHDVLALLSGLTLPPLVLACVVLLALSIARAISNSAHRSQLRAARRHPGAEGHQQHQSRRTSTAAPPNQAPASARSTTPSPGKRAA
jgi:hypothetical protein